MALKKDGNYRQHHDSTEPTIYTCPRCPNLRFADYNSLADHTFFCERKPAGHHGRTVIDKMIQSKAQSQEQECVSQ